MVVLPPPFGLCYLVCSFFWWCCLPPTPVGGAAVPPLALWISCFFVCFAVIRIVSVILITTTQEEDEGGGQLDVSSMDGDKLVEFWCSAGEPVEPLALRKMTNRQAEYRRQIAGCSETRSTCVSGDHLNGAASTASHVLCNVLRTMVFLRSPTLRSFIQLSSVL